MSTPHRRTRGGRPRPPRRPRRSTRASTRKWPTTGPRSENGPEEAWLVSQTLGSQGGNGRARRGMRRRRGTHEHVDDLQQTRDGLVVRHGRKVVDPLPSRKGHVAAEESRVVASGEGCVLPSSKSSVPRRGRVSGEGSVKVDRVEGRVEAQVGRGVVDRRLVKQGRVSRGLRVGCRWSREGGLVSREWLREERRGGGVGKRELTARVSLRKRGTVPL